MTDETREPETGDLYVGEVIDPKSGERAGEPFIARAADLTTHGVIVGMTGSGKTGLGVSLLEEALLSGVPCLIVDPKGDMGNLLLNFPDFQPSDFQPWIDEAEAKRAGVSVDELAASTAESWKTGLQAWGVSPERMRRLIDSVDMTIYTPGSAAGTPLNILGSLAAPDQGFDSDPETHRDEIEGYVQSLLTLAGVQSDPVSGREHILAATIVEQAWSGGRDLDLAALIGAIQTPPFRKMGVFELDSFFPQKDRTELAMKLNGLMASPSFASWMQGEPIDIGGLLERDGAPRAAIVTMSHLSDSERQFVVTLLLSKMVSWMRGQSGTTDLRALIYMDEVFGFAPPTAEPPSKKPILTILKQARAFGVGMVLSTQNPVDLDYKAMSNAGTWMIGRLQTERDKARILEGMESASGSVDISTFDSTISGLDKRQFVHVSTKRDEPQVFGTRWAMSYLAGPLTRDEIARLTPTDRSRDTAGEAVIATGAGAPTIEQEAVAAVPTIDTSDDSTSVAPAVPAGVAVMYADPAASWIGQIGFDPASTTVEAAAVATVGLLYDDQHAQVDHREVFEAIIHPLANPVTADNLHVVDHDERDFRGEPDAGVAYRLPDAAIDEKQFWKALEGSLETHLVTERRASVFKCPPLKLYSRIGETREAFVTRCQEKADDAADAELASLKDKYATRIDRVKDRLSKAERRAEELSVDVDTRKQHEMLSGAGDLLGAVLGGRRRGSAISRAASRRGQTRRTQERLETAQSKVTDELAELEELEDDLEDDVLDITDRWEAAATEVEEIDIPLEKTDISITTLGVVWVPVGP